MPQGQHLWSGRAGGQVISNRYSSQGEQISLGSQHKRAWTWGELLNSQSNKSDQDEILQYMKQNDLTENDQAAVSGFDIQREEVNFDMSWAYGMTSRWMFGLFIPVAQVTTKVASTVDVDGRTSSSFRTFAQSHGGKTENVERLVEDLVRSEIESQGYREIPTERQQWIWGDISLLNQYLVFSGVDTRWSLQQVLRMPTSRNPSLNDFALASRDEGQIDLGFTQFLERDFGSVTGVFGAGYINQLPGPIRVSQRDSDSTAIRDREVERNLGNIWWAGAESRFRLTPRLNFSGAYRYFYKEPDTLHLDQVIKSESQQAHLARLVTSYVFLPGDTRYGIERKWLVNFQVQSTLAGVNTDQLTSATIDIQTYF